MNLFFQIKCQIFAKVSVKKIFFLSLFRNSLTYLLFQNLGYIIKKDNCDQNVEILVQKFDALTHYPLLDELRVTFYIYSHTILYFLKSAFQERLSGLNLYKT